jgi:hypothetical protein
MALKHSKFRNPGVLFELLVRQTTADLLQNKDSKAVKILKKYFTETELSREYSLYNSFITTEKLNESKAELFINTIVEQYKKLDYEKLKKEKYNLIREIKSNYDLDNFFKAKIDNYKSYASIYIVLESQNNKTNVNQVLSSKITMLEHICGEEVKEKPASTQILEEFMKQDKEIRLLAYKILVEKFNKKYVGLSQDQKDVLKEYINNISDTKNLKVYLNKRLTEIKSTLVEMSNSVKDQVTSIKLKEVVKFIKPIHENETIKDETVSTLLQYYDLINEIKNVETNE